MKKKEESDGHDARKVLLRPLSARFFHTLTIRTVEWRIGGEGAGMRWRDGPVRKTLLIKWVVC